jgi:hypothetical protein|tara:strand:- start:254 stop:481 length:228 start_codon:yes stop_codon:yes gene_type:complete
MKWFIVVVMMTLSAEGHDAVEVSMANDEMLYFETKSECLDYVEENIVGLSVFAITEFGGENSVENIFCVSEEPSI